MKKNSIIIFLSLFYTLSCNARQHTKAFVKENNNASFNRLNWVEVTNTPISTQIMFDFEKPIYFQQKLLANKLLLTFPGIRLNTIKKPNINNHMAKLRQSGLIETVKMYENNEAPIATTLEIVFHQYNATKNATQNNSDEEKLSDRHTRKIPNRIIIKWSKREDPNRLVFDIFRKDMLDDIHKKEAILFKAANSNNNHPFFLPTVNLLKPNNNHLELF